MDSSVTLKTVEAESSVSRAAPIVLDRSLSASPGERTNFLQIWFVKLRWFIFAIVALNLVVSFNGQWRIGRDSSLYRAVGENLAAGRGYTFRGQHERHVYPGLPVLLAAVERICGHQDALRPRAALAVMLVMAGLTLVVVYQLVRTYFPEWIAVCVTTGVGINHGFVQQANELMTDLPFLLGVCLTLLGLARLPKASSGRQRAWAIVQIAVGAVLAISMRPTFWALAGAWAGACVVGLIGSRRRTWFGLGIAALVLLLAAWISLDPRTGGGSLFGGKYERMVKIRLSHFWQTSRADWQKHVASVFIKDLPEEVFGLEMPSPWGPIAVAILLTSSVLLVRQAPVWGLYVFVTIGMTLLLGSKGRYYLMVLPVLLTGWAVFAGWASRLSARWYRKAPVTGELVLLFWLGLATVPHIIRDAAFVMEQHGYGKDGSHRDFLQVYRSGKMQPLVNLTRTIRREVPEGQNVLGVEPRITTFLSGRFVFQPSEVLTPRKSYLWKDQLRKLGVEYLVLGEIISKDDTGKVTKDETKKMTSEMIKRRAVAVQAGWEVRVEGMRLVKITVPPTRNIPRIPRAKPGKARTQPTTKPVK